VGAAGLRRPALQTSDPFLPSDPSCPRHREIAGALGRNGFALADAFLPEAEIRGLADEARRGHRLGRFRHAGVGRGTTFRLRPEIRNDHVRWLDPGNPTRRERRYLAAMQSLRLDLNRELLLGLFGFEAHFAVYPPGARYRTHLDRFASASHRVVSAVLYLNEAWDAEDGGALRLYLGEPDVEPRIDFAPLGGRLVLFESGRFHHEVLPARRERYSLVGWFTTRP